MDSGKTAHHNGFVDSPHFDWQGGGSSNVKMANRWLKRLGFGARLRAHGSTGKQTNLERRINLYHLLSQALAYDVMGDIVEIGTYTGETAVMMQWIMDAEDPQRRLIHVYDSFEKSWGAATPREQLDENFRRHIGRPPQVHQGRFDATIPAQLPEHIAFASIDCGYGGPVDEHAATIQFLLESIYPRLSPGAVVVLVDYWLQDCHAGLNVANPGVQTAADRFLADKPEHVVGLYTGEYADGYFRKAYRANPAQSAG